MDGPDVDGRSKREVVVVSGWRVFGWFLLLGTFALSCIVAVSFHGHITNFDIHGSSHWREEGCRVFPRDTLDVVPWRHGPGNLDIKPPQAKGKFIKLPGSVRKFIKLPGSVRWARSRADTGLVAKIDGLQSQIINNWKRTQANWDWIEWYHRKK
jgi:hypothetical protein